MEAAKIDDLEPEVDEQARREMRTAREEIAQPPGPVPGAGSRVEDDRDDGRHGDRLATPVVRIGPVVVLPQDGGAVKQEPYGHAVVDPALVLDHQDEEEFAVAKRYLPDHVTRAFAQGLGDERALKQHRGIEIQKRRERADIDEAPHEVANHALLTQKPHKGVALVLERVRVGIFCRHMQVLVLVHCGVQPSPRAW